MKRPSLQEKWSYVLSFSELKYFHLNILESREHRSTSLMFLSCSNGSPVEVVMSSRPPMDIWKCLEIFSTLTTGYGGEKDAIGSRALEIIYILQGI